MSILYMDTSALVKYYITETGSDWTRSLLESSTSRVFTSLLTGVEAVCAFARRRRESMLSADDYGQLLKVFHHDFTYRYSILAVESIVIEKATQLAHRQPLRAYDAVHLATACLLDEELRHTDELPLTFVCADVQLNDLASTVGLVAENPNRHG